MPSKYVGKPPSTIEIHYAIEIALIELTVRMGHNKNIEINNLAR